MGPIDKIFWMRIGFGIIAGIVAGAVGYLSFNPEAFKGIGIGFMIYFASYIVARFFMGRNLPPTDYRKMVTTGMAGYVFMFMFVWIMYNTFVLTEQTG
ncbi:MAG: hypothetical protein ACE5KA_02295 [Nitrososphaerales archaeon]